MTPVGRPGWPVRRDERGSFLPLFALLLVALITMTAIAVDLAALHTDRRSDKLAADVAATAGAAKLDTTATGRYAACLEAWDYAARNLGYPDGTAGFGQDSTVCAPFQAGSACSDSATPPAPTPAGDAVSGSMGGYTVTITTPVENTSTLMTTADDIGGGRSQGITTSSTGNTDSDGGPCERIGVTVSYSRQPMFATVIGAGAASTTLHAVALTANGAASIPASVVLLDPHDCSVFVQNSASGGVSVNDPTGATRGGIVVVSDATSQSGAGPCTQLSTNNDYEAEAKGSGSGNGIILNPGDLYLGAYVGTNCGATHACNQGQISVGSTQSNISIEEVLNGPYVQPNGIPPAIAPLTTRTLIDYVFNCNNGSHTVYTPAEYNPPRDSSSTPVSSTCQRGTPDYVNEYVHGVQSGALLPSGSADVVHACGGLSGTMAALPVGTAYYDFKCDTSALPNNVNLTVVGDAVFEQASITPGAVSVSGTALVDGSLSITNGSAMTIGGNAYFDGQVSLSGSGVLSVISSGGTAYATTYSGCTGTGYVSALATCVYGHADDFHTVYLDSGFSLKQTGGTLTFDHTFGYEVGSTLSLGGGGSINWSPPSAGPFDQFNSSTGGTTKLSLWSDGVGSGLVGGGATQVQSLAGGGGVSMSGVFFTPAQCWQLTGNNNVGTAGGFKAQFIAYCMEQDGSSHFQLTPDVDFARIPLRAGPELIR
jgi:hypothetical protein